MAHKTLIGGTAYNIIGGKSLVSGTSYNIKGGKTLVGGTGYSISFAELDPLYAMYYSDNSIVFQRGNIPSSGKSLQASYSGFDGKIFTNARHLPWHSYLNQITNVSFGENVSTKSMTLWFNSAQNLTTINWANFNLDSVVDMTNTFYWCTNLKGSPVCGNNVNRMSNTYKECSNLTGSPVCGPNVVDLSDTYNGCRNLTGSPVCGNKVKGMAYAYYECTNLRGDMYMYSKNVSNMRNCFYNRNTSNRLNIYIYKDSKTHNCFNITNTRSLVGKNITWTQTDTGFYNTSFNLYVYYM